MALLWQSVRLLLESLLESLPTGQHILQHRAGAAHLDVLTPGKTAHGNTAIAEAIRISAPTAVNLEQHFTPRDDQVWKRAAKGRSLAPAFDAESNAPQYSLHLLHFFSSCRSRSFHKIMARRARRRVGPKWMMCPTVKLASRRWTIK